VTTEQSKKRAVYCVTTWHEREIISSSHEPQRHYQSMRHVE